MERVNVGILGGAFDPPHVGHVALAETSVRAFHLARLLVRVVADPGHRDVESSAEDRLALARIAFAPIAVAEVALDPYAWTVDSLDALGLDDPVFLLGADEFSSFPTWKEPERVLELTRLGVATRPGVDDEAVAATLASLSRPECVVRFPIPALDVSSTAIRERVSRGEPVGGLVPENVEREILRRGLYRRS